MTTLLDLTYRPHFRGKDGDHGQSWDKAGRNGEDLIVKVPVGTVVIYDGKVLGDLKENGQTLLVARGGRGGRGNATFKTSRNIAPKIAEKGEPGEVFELDLELKLFADAGFIGCPNAGKSTLLSRISSARPKIAEYPFTTLYPNLGVAKFKDKSFVAADIPGLIEGAHKGKGLGSEFLRHIERTRVLVHLVDSLGYGDKTPLENYRAVQEELALYSKKLAKRPTIVAITKMDCTGADIAFKNFKKHVKGKKVLQISAVSGEGLEKLQVEILKLLEKVKGEKPEEIIDLGPERFVFEQEFSVVKENAGFRVKGKKVERFVAMTNFDQDQAVSRLQNIIKKMGVEKLLQKEGIQTGDTVYIGSMEFNYSPM